VKIVESDNRTKLVYVTKLAKIHLSQFMATPIQRIEAALQALDKE